MKLLILSDLHTEFSSYPHPINQNCDVVVLAGDIGTKLSGVKFALTTNKPTIYCFGNHEYYGGKLHSLDKKATEMTKGSNVYFGNNKTFIIDDVRFLVTVCWTDYELYGNGPLAEYHAQQNLNDFKKIRTGPEQGYRKILARDIRIEHQLSKMWLMDELAKPFDGKTVVVSHHAPSELSVAEQYLNDPLTPAYASRLENVMLYNDIALWVHGHNHNSSDYMIGDTRVVCNPQGYIGVDVNPTFNPNFVVEI
jgi:predicted phosphodiesterase